MFKTKAPWLISIEKVETHKVYARINFSIQPKWIEAIGQHLLKTHYQDIHWRKNRGQTTALLNQSLLGLPIVHQRIVDYGQIDPILARSHFLMNGLVEGAIKPSFPFLKKNTQSVLESRTEEEKLRSHHLLIDANNFSELYAKQVPESIISVSQLTRWLKRDWDARNAQLTFKKEILILNDTHVLDDYPSEIEVKGVLLPITYCFSPTEKHDGIHVAIPKAMLTQFTDSDFEWLVPGYLKDKILATLKKLPKSIRKFLIPLNETAEKCFQYITQMDYIHQRYTQLLSKAIMQVRQMHVDPSAIITHDFPPHLSMTFVLFNEKKTASPPLYYSQLAELQKTIHHQKRELSSFSLPSSQKHSLNQKYQEWPNDFMGIEQSLKKDNPTFRAFYGIVDYDRYVKIESFSSRLEAQSKHIQGIACLLILENISLIQWFKKNWPERSDLEKLSLRLGGFSVILHWMAYSCILSLLPDPRNPIESQSLFDDFKTKVHSLLREKLAEQLISVQKTLKRYQDIYHQLDILPKAYHVSVKDIRQQIQLLWTKETVINKQSTFFNDLFRYQQGIQSRIHRLCDNYPREALLLNDWNEWKAWWNEWNSEELHNEALQQHVALRWMLEEYRIYLFSLNVKTQGKISTKKLQLAFERLVALNKR
jgi:ATP-dependent helicase HrpA